MKALEKIFPIIFVVVCIASIILSIAACVLAIGFTLHWFTTHEVESFTETIDENTILQTQIMEDIFHTWTKQTILH